jgi:hypothetical protein
MAKGRKHTLRRVMPYLLKKEKFDLRCERRNIKYFDDTSREFAVTAIDEFFDDSFVQFNLGGNMNKNNNWVDVEEALESLCINKRKRYTRDHQLEYIYEVPIIGYKLFTTIQKSDDDNFGINEEYLKKSVPKVSNPYDFLFWCGKFYDIHMLHIFDPENPNQLREFAPVVPPSIVHTLKTSNKRDPVKLPVSTIRSSKCSHHHLSANQCIIKHNKQHSTFGFVAQGEHDYLEINLGEPRLLTHIGLCGGYPATYMFPSRHTVGRRRFRATLEENGGGTASAPYIYVAKTSDINCFVTSYELSYRDILTRKWQVVGLFPGCTDSTTERVSDLQSFYNHHGGLLAQCIRIRVVSFEGHPVMRLALYGHMHSDDEKEREGLAAQSETVEYVLRTEVGDREERSFSVDGGPCSGQSTKRWHYDYDKKQYHTRATKHHTRARLVREELEGHS